VSAKDDAAPPPTSHAGPGRTGPTLRVVAGDATAEEIAAVLAVVTARGAGRAEAGAAGPGADGPGADGPGAEEWSAHGHAHRHVRATFTPSANGWRTSYWPR